MILAGPGRAGGSVGVKVCGVTRPADAALAAALGADAVGVVLWPGSPRFVDPDLAQAIAAALPPAVLSVGVFVDTAAEEAFGIAAGLGLGAIQLHGGPEPGAGGPLPVLRAIPVDGPGAVASAAGLPADVAVLLDADDPVRRGGTGRAVDRGIAARIAGHRPVILAGGLQPGTVGRAIAAVRPAAVDVSSGVEERPGVKHRALLEAFFAAVRDARAELPG